MILIVDDHEDTGRLLCRTFLAHGYAAHHCSHSRDALQVLQDFRPSLFILDLMMPDVSGLDLLQKIRRHPDLSSLPVFVYSGSDADDHRSEAEALGVDAYVLKRGETRHQLLALAERFLGPAKPSSHRDRDPADEQKSFAAAGAYLP